MDQPCGAITRCRRVSNKNAAAATDNPPVEVSENDDEVVVTAAVIAGITKKDLTLDLNQSSGTGNHLCTNGRENG